MVGRADRKFFLLQAGALRAGVDLAHVFCEKSAGTAIKSYSPELIVHPLLAVARSGEPKDEAIRAVGEWIPRVDGLLVGPGLGRDPMIVEVASELIAQVCLLHIFVVFLV